MKTGEIFHGLRLLERCGGGAFGEVWRCQDITGAFLALKLVRKEREHFELQGLAALRASARIDHANVVKIHHVDEDEEFLWYTMDIADNLGNDDHYLPDTLENRILRKRPVDVVQLGLELLAGLEALHAAGVVHRDLKPGNILFIRDRAVLADVGMAASATLSLSLAGTLGFIPPEIRSGTRSPGQIGPEGDFYALGMVMYCTLTGNAPEQFPALPADLVGKPAVSRLNRLILRMCDRHLWRRLTEAARIAAELQSIATAGDEPPRRKFRWVALGAAAAVVALGAGGFWLYRAHSKPQTPPAPPAPPVSVVPAQPAQPAQPTQPTQPTQPAQPAQPAPPESKTEDDDEDLSKYEIVRVDDYTHVPEISPKVIHVLPEKRQVIARAGKTAKPIYPQRNFEYYPLTKTAPGTGALADKIWSVRRAALDAAVDPALQEKLARVEPLGNFTKWLDLNHGSTLWWEGFKFGRAESDVLPQSKLQYPQNWLVDVPVTPAKSAPPGVDILLIDDPSCREFRDVMTFAKLPELAAWLRENAPDAWKNEDAWRKLMFSPQGFALYPGSYVKVDLNSGKNTVSVISCENAETARRDWFIKTKKGEIIWIAYFGLFWGDRDEIRKASHYLVKNIRNLN